MLKKSLGLVSAAALTTLIGIGCTVNSTSTPTTSDDAGNGGGTEAGKVVPGGDDASVTTDAGAMGCSPEDVDGLTLAYFPPPAPGLCTDAQIDALAAACFTSSSTAEGCKAFTGDAANKACVTNCIALAPKKSGDPAGPLFFNPFLDVPGCLARFESSPTKETCSGKLQALYVCGFAACGSDACQADMEGEGKEFSKCFAAATSSTGVCKTYAAAASCANDAFTGAAAVCDPKDGNADVNIFKAICGGGTGAVVDSGAPADATAD